MRLLVAVARYLVFTFLGMVIPSTCVACWCWVRLTIKFACWSNSLHGYFFPLYTLIFCLIVTFPSWILLTFMYSLLVLSEIAHWSCLMITFSALVFPDIQKCPSSLAVLAEIFNPRICWRKDFNFLYFIHLYLVFIDMTLSSCPVVIFPTWILHYFIYSSLVFNDTSCWSFLTW